jgi:hypothetical protein
VDASGAPAATAVEPLEAQALAAPAAVSEAIEAAPAEAARPTAEPVTSVPRTERTAAIEPAPAPQSGAEEPVARVVAEATTIPVVQPAVTPEPTAGVEAASRPQAQPPRPRAESPTLAVDAKAFLGEAGLQLVETDPSKAASTQPEPEPVKLGRARTERPRQADEELVQVETRK